MSNQLLDLSQKGEKCTCSFCKTHDLYRWAVISECPCGCHSNEHITGHDGLCCPFPNGKHKDSPYTELDPSKRYLALLQLLEDNDDDEMKTYDRKRMEELRLNNESKKYEQILQKDFSTGQDASIGEICTNN